MFSRGACQIGDKLYRWQVNLVHKPDHLRVSSGWAGKTTKSNRHPNPNTNPNPNPYLVGVRYSNNNNNNSNANICIARLKQNSSGALMAQTNTVLVFVQMTAVTASGVADRPQDCSKLLLQWLRSSFCRVLFLLSLFLNLFMRYPVTVTV